MKNLTFAMKNPPFTKKNYRAAMKNLARLLLVIWPVSALSAAPEYVLEIQNHLFNPDILRVPAGSKIRLGAYI